MSNSEKTKRLNINIPENLHIVLKIQAAKEKITVRELVTEILKEKYKYELMALEENGK